MRRLAAFVFTAASVLMVVSSCKKERSPEDQVRAVVLKALKAVNDKRVGDVVEDALPSFKGPRNADLRECRRILTGYFMQQGWLRAFPKDLDVEVRGDTAKATLDVLLARGDPVESIEDVMPKNAANYEFEFDLDRTTGDWKFARATYRRKTWPLPQP